MVIVLRWVNDEKNTLCREHNDVNLPRSLTNLRAISDLTKIATQFFYFVGTKNVHFHKKTTHNYQGGCFGCFHVRVKQIQDK